MFLLHLSRPRWALLGLLLVLGGLPAGVAHAQRPQLSLGFVPLGGTNADSATVYFEQGATTGFDSDFDASKMPNSSGLNVASLAADGQLLAINGLPPDLLASSFTVPLSVGGPAYGTYTLQVGQLIAFPATTIYLADAELMTRTRLERGSSYAFELTAANTSASYATRTRFALQFVPSAPLPVVLTFFTALAQPGGVQLSWGTASEKASAYFAIERSPNGQSFAELARVAAAGTRAAGQHYSWRDTDPSLGNGVCYYRLRQVDLDGSATYSPVRAAAAGPRLALFPNPAALGITTLLGAPPGATVDLYDALGRRWLRTTTTASGTAQLLLPPGLPSGSYVVRAGTCTQRLLVP